jgi:hypothetical protein
MRKLAAAYAVVLIACSSSDGGGGTVELTGSECTKVEECFPGVDQTKLKGTATCLTKVTSGYCTHTCTADTDCCAVAGECKTNTKQVCAPFESTAQKYCFLSCETADLPQGTTDANVYCQQFANRTFGCRSTGGGAMNRKICAP